MPDHDPLAEAHVPSVGGWCDSGVYLECDCGWTNEPPYKGVALSWSEHLDAAGYEVRPKSDRDEYAANMARLAEQVDDCARELANRPKLTADRLQAALYDGLSDRGVVRIDADSPKELGDVAAAILAAIAAHEVALKERGWWDEYEVETNIAMNYGEGMAEGRDNERARILAAVDEMPNARMVRGTYMSRVSRAAVLAIIGGSDDD